MSPLTGMPISTLVRSSERGPPLTGPEPVAEVDAGIYERTVRLTPLNPV
jgi:hypothetical protein